jgi:hypothetical protein
MESDLIGLNQFLTSIGFWTYQTGMGFFFMHGRYEYGRFILRSISY